MPPGARVRRQAEDFTVGWICALPIELTAAEAMLDEQFEGTSDIAQYTLGRIGSHNVAIGCLPAGQMGTTSAAVVATAMQAKFPALRFGLMVGIGAGVPSKDTDIRVGDVVISQPSGRYGGVVQYDYGKTLSGGTHLPTGSLNAPPTVLLKAVAKLRSTQGTGISRILSHLSLVANQQPEFCLENAGLDILFQASYDHIGGSTCDQCAVDMMIPRPERRPEELLIHYGTIASGNQVMRDGPTRDRISADFGGVLCFEMEGAGLMNSFPCLVIRGICDYADSHKSKSWQPRAAGAAAACAKELFSFVPTDGSRKWLSRPIFMIPFQRENNFIGRQHILEKLQMRYEQSASKDHLRLALVGLGGVGKSQIAIEFAYRAKMAHPELSIWWVYASNVSRFEQAYRDIALQLHIPHRDMDVRKAVYQWLCNSSNGSWIMLLDNVGDDNVFQGAEGEEQPLEAFLPRTANGFILITSRNEMAAMNLIGMPENILKVDAMSEEDALALLRTKVPEGGSDVDAKKLVQVLEGIPMAVTHAGAYISMRGPRTTVSSYLESFLASKANQTYLLSSADFKDPQRDFTTRQPVIKTWHISFEQIRKNNPAATDLLALMSMFDRQGVPEDLVLHGQSHLEFEDAVAPLINYSLITATRGGKSFEMHRLVQLSTVKWLEANELIDHWNQESLQIMVEAFPLGYFETRSECQRLLPHATKVIEAMSQSPSNAWIRLANRVGSHLRHIGRYYQADSLLRWALAKGKQSMQLMPPGLEPNGYGSGQESSSKSKHEEMNDLSYSVLRAANECRSDNSNPLWPKQSFERAFEKPTKPPPGTTRCSHPRARQHASGMIDSGIMIESRDHPRRVGTQGVDCEGSRSQILPGSADMSFKTEEFLSIATSLSLVLCHQYKHREAEAICRRALSQINGTRLSPYSPAILEFMSQFGQILVRQGNLEEGEPVVREVLEKRKTVLGEDHVDTLSSMHSLAGILRHQGNYEQAEALCRQVLEKQNRIMGPEHPNTLSIMNDLAVTLGQSGKRPEASKLYREALESIEKEEVLGPEHPRTLKVMGNLGSSLIHLHEYGEAETLLRRALRTAEKSQAIGQDSPAMFGFMSNLGWVLFEMGKFEESEGLCRRSFNGYRELLGAADERTRNSAENLAYVLEEQGKDQEAAEVDAWLEETSLELQASHPPETEATSLPPVIVEPPIPEPQPSRKVSGLSKLALRLKRRRKGADDKAGDD